LGEKKLAAGFITRFFQHFPTLAESAMDAMLDLIEDDIEKQIGALSKHTSISITNISFKETPY